MQAPGTPRPRITRARLVALSVLSVPVLALSLVASYSFATRMLGLPHERAAQLVGFTGLVCLAAAVRGTVRSFKRYWPEGSPPPRRLDPRAKRFLGWGPILLMLCALSSAYVLAHHSIYVGLAASTATAIVARFVVSRLRQIPRD